MKTKHFLSALENERVHEAIRKAEAGTSGDIVVYITHKEAPDALAAAREVFTRRHLEKSAHDNSLLIFLAPLSQTFAVVGGKALHEAVGQAWWDELAGVLRTHFRASYFTEGLVESVRMAGHALKRHFPAKTVDRAGQADVFEE